MGGTLRTRDLIALGVHTDDPPPGTHRRQFTVWRPYEASSMQLRKTPVRWQR
jgi:hypothetical protein